MADLDPLRHSRNDLYPEVFRRTRAALLLSDEHGMVDEANAAMGRALGRTARDLRTQDLSLLLHPEDRGGIRSRLATLAQLSTGGTAALNVRLLPRPGAEVRARAHGTVLGASPRRPRLLWEFRSTRDVALHPPDDAEPASDDGTGGLLPAPRPLRVVVLARRRAVGEAMVSYLRPLECAEEVLLDDDPSTVLRAVRRGATDLVVANARANDLDPIEFARAVRSTPGGARVVFTGLEEDDDLVVSLVEEGADGFVFRGGSLIDLAAAVNAAARDELALPPAVAARVTQRLSELARILRSRAFDPDAYETLTPREREVFGHLAGGRTNREIGNRLGIQEGTVKTHVHHILTKLDLQGREQAADYLAVARTESDEQSRK